MVDSGAGGRADGEGGVAGVEKRGLLSKGLLTQVQGYEVAWVVLAFWDILLKEAKIGPWYRRTSNGTKPGINFRQGLDRFIAVSLE